MALETEEPGKRRNQKVKDSGQNLRGETAQQLGAHTVLTEFPNPYQEAQLYLQLHLTPLYSHGHTPTCTDTWEHMHN